MTINKKLVSTLLPHRAAFSVVVVAGFLAGITAVLQAWLISRTTELVFLQKEGFPGVSPLLISLAGLVLLRGALVWLGKCSAALLATRVQSDFRRRLHAHLNALGPGFFRQGASNPSTRTGELVSLLTQGVDTLEEYFSQYLPQTVMTVLVPGTILAAVFPVDLVSGLVMLVTAPLFPLFMLLVGDRAEKLTNQQWTLLRRMGAHFLDVVQGLETLKIFGRSKDQTGVIERVGNDYRHTTMGVLRVAFLSALVLEWLVMLSTAIVAVEIGLRLLAGQLTLGTAFFVLLLAPEFYLPFRQLGMRFHAGMAGFENAKKMFAILEMKPVEAGTMPYPNAVPPPRGQPPRIEFAGVTFGFPDDRPILEGLNFVIEPGEIFAVIGPNGGGKSTLVDILLGFIHPLRGEVRVDGIPLESVSMASWREQIAWVPQRPYLFDASAADNIRLGRQDADLDKVIAAARLAGADEFIARLPQGYGTVIGERGQRLSGGQAQRIALARAILKKASILILDEAMTNIDPETGSRLMATILEIYKGRTVLLVSHDFNAVRAADRVLVIESGRIAAIAPPEELFGGDIHPLRLLKPGFRQRLWTPEESLLSAPRSIAIQGFSPSQTAAQHLQFIPDTRPGSLVTLLRMLSPFKARVLVAIIVGWAAVVSGIGLLGTSAYLLFLAALHPSIAVLQLPIVALRAFGLARGLFRYCERLISHDTTFRILTSLRSRLFAALEPLAPARLQHFHSAELFSRLYADVTSLDSFFVRAASPPLIWFLVLLTVTAFLARFSLTAAIITLAFQLVIGLFLPPLVYRAGQTPGRALVVIRSRLNTSLVDGIQGMPDLQAFGAERQQVRVVGSADFAYASISRRLGMIAALHTAAENALADLAELSVLVAGIFAVQAGLLDGVYLGMLILTCLASFETVSPVAQSARVLAQNLAAAGRIERIITLQPAVVEPQLPSPKPERYDLEVSDLSFAYPPSMADSYHNLTDYCTSIDPYAIKKITFSLPEGKKMAIIGPSGSGKTTIASLLMRFWDYSDGKICLGGEDLRQLKTEDVRSLISLVSQRTHLFNATILDNLRVANPEADIEMIVKATERARIHDFILSLPSGYDTWIGEHGARLSSGERQRLALARALLKNSPILILDEPASNLDAWTEYEILDTLLNLPDDRSILMITHHPTGLEFMDEILVLEGGAITQRGRHPDLIRYPGYYRRMWALVHGETD